MGLVLGVLRAALYVLATTSVTLVGNILQLLSFALFPFGPATMTAANCWCAGQLWRFLQWLFEAVDGARFVYSGDEVPLRENAVIIANHSGFSDFYLVQSLAYRKAMLANCKYFAKDALKWIPFFGWGMYMMGNLMLRRNWMEDQRRINETFHFLTSNRIPVWLVSYLEGTRATPTKIKESQNFCKERNLPLLNNLLSPRTKGFVATISALRGSHVTHVYDMTFGYTRRRGSDFEIHVPSILEIGMNGARDLVLNIHVRRYAIADLPTDDEALSNWVIERFVEKDKMIDELRSRGHFNAVVRDEPFVFRHW